MEDAIRLIKMETDIESTNYHSVDELRNQDFRRLEAEDNETICKLKEEIKRLKQHIMKLTNEKEFRRNPDNFRDRRDVICHNCKSKGHIARFCKKIECFKCGIPHLQRFCHKNTKEMRFLSGDEQSINVQNDDNTNSSDTLSEKDCNLLESKRWDKRKTKEVMSQLKKSSRQDKYAQFINGQGAKPKRCWDTSETVITTRRPEKAKNKPLVECKVENEKVKILFDTGAELNVISEELVSKLMETDDSIRMRKSTNRIRCANGSVIKPSGCVYQKISIGINELYQYFDVVPGLFPECFIGILYMKKDGISVIPSKDCIKVNGIEIPFVSTTKIESLNC